MDLKPFKLDIDELLDEFTEGNYLTLADLKRLWMERKFSYIFEARPIKNSALFMQSLYTHCIGHMISAGPLSRRLGALYFLYCLHEIQPYRPRFKIYISLGELRKLRNLIEEAKQNEIRPVPALVKKMLEKNIILFGFVDMLGNSTKQKVDVIAMQQRRRVEVAYDNDADKKIKIGRVLEVPKSLSGNGTYQCWKQMLFAESNIERYLDMSLGADLELENYKKMLSEYEQAKAIAIQEARETIDIADVKHLIENKKITANVMDEIVNKWDTQKDEYYEKTGIIQLDQIISVDNCFQENFLGE